MQGLIKRRDVWLLPCHRLATRSEFLALLYKGAWTTEPRAQQVIDEASLWTEKAKRRRRREEKVVEDSQ